MHFERAESASARTIETFKEALAARNDAVDSLHGYNGDNSHNVSKRLASTAPPSHPIHTNTGPSSLGTART